MSLRKSRRRCPQRRLLRRLWVERLEDRTLLAGDFLAIASLLQPTDRLDAVIGASGEVDRFQFTLAETGRLTVRTAGLDLDTRTSLLGPDGQLLIQSDGASAADPDDLIVVEVGRPDVAQKNRLTAFILANRLTSQIDVGCSS